MNTPSIKTPVRVRFAPSPTGFLHLGGVRTALYVYLFARQNNGTFILRIEDTDRARYVPEAEQYIIDILKTFGLDYDEGPIRQSDRLPIYQKYAHELMERGLAYPSFVTEAELEVARSQTEAEGKVFRFDASMRTPYDDEAKKKIADGVPYSIRFIMPQDGATDFDDIVRGHVEIKNDQLEDLVILKSDGYPTYNFANVVDDHDMGITHVLRGDEFVTSTPKHILMYHALGWEPPTFAHLSQVLGKTGTKKLSKREGAQPTLEYTKQGYLVPALINFLAFLGWRPSKSDQEIFTLEELVQAFRLEDVQKAGAVFDVDKLNWFQRTWTLKLAEEYKDAPEKHPLYGFIKNIFESKFGTVSDASFAALWPAIVERLHGPEEYENVADEFSFFFTEPSYEGATLIWKKSDAATTKDVLQKLQEFLGTIPEGDWQAEKIEPLVKNFIQENGWDNGTALWPLRVSLSGKEKSMGPFEIMEMLAQIGKRGAIRERIERAIAEINTK
jgi:glutamyl-tRNA synthetase